MLVSLKNVRKKLVAAFAKMDTNLIHAAIVKKMYVKITLIAISMRDVQPPKTNNLDISKKSALVKLVNEEMDIQHVQKIGVVSTCINVARTPFANHWAQIINMTTTVNAKTDIPVLAVARKDMEAVATDQIVNCLHAMKR